MSRYHELRQLWTPETVKIAFVLESPPESGKYFYDTSGATSEPLFRAMMRLIDISPATKTEGLVAFREAGWVLVDATYTPVDGMSTRQRNAVIEESYNHLVADLRSLGATKILVAKVNVVDLLADRLAAEGFDVLNKGARIPFPSHGNQSRFHEMATTALQPGHRGIADGH